VNDSNPEESGRISVLRESEGNDEEGGRVLPSRKRTSKAEALDPPRGVNPLPRRGRAIYSHLAP
jgi:hypothetical protein